MADNEPSTTPLLGGRRLSDEPTSRFPGSKGSEFLYVTYSIEKSSGLRTNKKTNSFRASTSTSLKTLVQAVMKKIKFSTRYKYMVIYFDPIKNSKRYAEWRKFKEKLDLDYGKPLKLRVCRFKLNAAKPQNEVAQPASVPAVQTPTQFSGLQNYNLYAAYQQQMAMFYMFYVNCCQMQRMQNFMP